MFAGHFIDKVNRKRILQLCDIGFIIASVFMLFAITYDPFSIIFLIFINFITGLLSCFKMLTFQTTTSMFIDKKNLLKYNGFISVLQNTPLLLGPILGGVLLSLITMKEIILIDIVSFFVGFCFTTVISFPNMKYAKRKSLKWNQIVFSTQYIFKNKSLKNILLLFTIENFLGGLTLGLVTAFLLAKTNGDNLITAYTFSLVAVGGIIGGFIAYRVPKLMIHPFRNILIIFFLSGLVG
ncbi:MAG: MFS transporter, partial [Bdellovibrionaceae bacterium]|nr:MFS transporter [Pseudobdellovibrionaceae bacterium]